MSGSAGKRARLEIASALMRLLSIWAIALGGTVMPSGCGRRARPG
jgi:hypothetical protein